MDIRNFFGGKPSKSENNKKAMPKAKDSKGKKPIPTYTSDPSDSEDPIPSRLAKRYKDKNVETKPKKGRPRKAAKDRYSDDSDFAEEPKTSKKSSTKTTKLTKSSKEPQLRPISASAYFHGDKKPKGSESERFSATVKKCGKDLVLWPIRNQSVRTYFLFAPQDSPKPMEVVQSKKSPRKRRKRGSDLEELLDLDGEPKASVSSPAKKRAVQTEVENPRKVTAKSPAKTPPSKSPRKKVGQEREDSGHLEAAQSPAATRRRSYADYLKREGPRALGSKEIPEAKRGTEDCLAGLTFVISGILESITRDDAKALILKHGGRVTTAVSHKTNFLLLGRDAGESKSAKAKELGVKVLSDDDLYNMIRSKSAKGPKKAEPTSPSPKKKKKVSDVPSTAVSSLKDEAPTEAKANQFDLWPEKYKPTTLKQVIGQQGPKSCLNKLLAWLRSWHQWHGHGANKKTGAKKFGASDDGSSFKAALLSGPPGIGKTTTAQLCCEELHFPFVERNASDARNKKLLEQTCSASLTSRCLEQYYCKDFRSDDFEDGLNHVLIMDEVDGMSGNEDRAGMQGLIDLIKRTRVPIICICNDRQSPKVRSLANHCFDLRFHRPQTLQIRSALMSIVHKEHLSVSPQTLDQLIEASQHDIRQVLHNLSLMTTNKQNVTFDEARRSVKKDVNMNIFEATRSLFTDAEGSAQLSLIDRAEIFFTDYSLVPLFVQENYPHCVAANNMLDRLALLAEAAQFIADGDVVDKQIRSSSSWSLLNLQATFSTVIPTELMKGYLKGQINFPAWFGKNSKIGRLFRQLQQLHLHTSIHSSADTASICLDYVDHMRDSIMAYLNRDDIANALDLCQSYDMSKDDVDTIMELGTWPHRKDPMSKLSSKTKAAFTRAFNTSTHMLPYDVVGATLNRRKRLPVDTLDVAENGQETVDAMDQLASDDDSSDDEDTALLLKAAKVKSAPAKGGAAAKKGRGGTKATSGRKKAVVNV
ncbi:hypothetical protein M514_03934 [Trichuris suis]|uniref:Replication factor C subunit 1 n=1 Tax=Trichuris suis TaxID=68888 RepID=A0A085N8W2_9BILA|nr:hypothetical protein M513_03934 [Trichuris suis]KFD65908.1 hypothetical protein M514_03934 [Trichuris suis]